MFKKQMLAGFVLAAAMIRSGAADVPSTSPDKTVPGPKADAIEPAVKAEKLPAWRDLDRWSFQVGVGFITQSTIDEIILGDGERATGKGEGEIYLLQASYKLAALEPKLWSYRPKIDIELPLVLGIVNENDRDSPFMQYNGGVTARWKSFPWNEWLYTNLESGVGLTYSQYVLTTERERHPDRDRSHVEIYWPVQLLLAHPRYRQHQLALFLHHHSGGWVFHEGGANTLGAGYRYVPGER